MKLNNWYVLTGGPSAGKTTAIKILEEQGYRVVPEAARLYIDQEMEKGKTIEQIRENELSFQEEVLKMKIQIEKELPKEEVIFFDRGIPDTDAYYKLCGRENDPFLLKVTKDCFYKKIFLLDFFEMKKDYARTENREEQIKIHNLLEDSYKAIKVPIIKVPRMESKQDRVEFILSNL